MASPLDIIKKEWEKALFFVSLFLVLMISAITLLVILGSKEKDQILVSNNDVKSVYTENAFNFIRPQKVAYTNHAFIQRGQKPRIKAGVPNISDGNTDKDGNENGHIIINDDKPTTKEQASPPQSKPPIEYKLKYLGYIKSTQGEQRAWLVVKSEIEGVAQKTKSIISEEGETIRKFILTNYDAEQAMFQTANGQQLRVSKGQEVLVERVKQK